VIDSEESDYEEIPVVNGDELGVPEIDQELLFDSEKNYFEECLDEDLENVTSYQENLKLREEDDAFDSLGIEDDELLQSLQQEMDRLEEPE